MAEHIYKFYHCSDPGFYHQDGHVWTFVYLDGQAQAFNEEVAEAGSFDWNESDRFVCDEPKPKEPGDYKGDLYGLGVTAFLRLRYGNLDGRVAAPTDLAAYESAKDEKTWR